MSIRSLFLYNSPHQYFEENLKSYSSSYKGYNYIDFIKQNNIYELYHYTELQINKYNINALFILFDNCDSSLDFDFLVKLKRLYKIKFIFIFKDSQNSYEYIDRYYAQIADLAIIDKSSCIDEFYSLLNIPIMTTNILNDFDESSHPVILNNVFSSQLINLTVRRTPFKKDSQSIEQNNKLPYFETEIDSFFQEMFNKIKKYSSPNFEFSLDKKFEFSQEIYEIYWILYGLTQQKNKFNAILKLIKFKNFKYLYHIFKLYLVLRKQRNVAATPPNQIINLALFKKCEF